MYRVMLVDDESLIQDSLSKYIKTKLPDFDVVGIYGNGAEALNALQETPADIVITDIRMPVMNGLELVEKLREQSLPCVPIIISGYSEFAYAKTAMQAGVIYYLLKPLDFEELHRSLEAAAAIVRRNRLLSSLSNCLQEEQELFFIDLMSGKLDLTGMSARFQELRFPFSLDESGGIFLRTTMVSWKENWNYGKETIGVALLNLLQTLYHPRYVSSVVRAENQYDFLVISPDAETFDFTMFCANASSLLSLSIRAIPLFAFGSIKDLFDNPHLSALPDSYSRSEPDGSEKKALIQKALQYMQEHYGDDLSREDVAATVYMSSAHFSRSFKQEVGISFQDYLVNIRMQKAIELMNTNMKIQDIAKTVGYPSRNRFYINFRNYTSYSPVEYRRNVLKIFA